MSSADADTMEGAADIGASVDSATATAVGAVVDVDVGVGPGATAVSSVDAVPGCATVCVAVAVNTHDQASMGR
jgi:hypothetical protein